MANLPWLKAKWLDTLKEAGLYPEGPRGDGFETLVAQYSGKHDDGPPRYYHTLDHIEACLRLREARFDVRFSNVDLALWFHDFYYDMPNSELNEVRSANTACALMCDYAPRPAAPLGMSGEVVDLFNLIMVTKTHSPRSRGESIVSDVDMSILGESPEVFALYEDQIQKEYSWVPPELYRQGRKEVLENFFNSKIYHTSEMGDYEERAKSNLREAILKLEG